MTGFEIRNIASTWLRTPYRMGGNSHDGVDCSHFVWEVLKAAGHSSAPYVTAGQIPSSPHYSKVDSLPSTGDIVHFGGTPAHVGIVLDPAVGIFVGAQTSTGVAEASYTHGYWAGRQPTFFRYSGP
jgi:cell wall-associated NlpC family hydrolase